jgi:hypothetical protein
VGAAIDPASLSRWRTVLSNFIYIDANIFAQNIQEEKCGNSRRGYRRLS